MFESGRRRDSNMQPSNINKNNLVAPTGFEPVFESRSRFRQESSPIARCLVPRKSTGLKHDTSSANRAVATSHPVASTPLREFCR